MPKTKADVQTWFKTIGKKGGRPPAPLSAKMYSSLGRWFQKLTDRKMPPQEIYNIIQDQVDAYHIVEELATRQVKTPANAEERQALQTLRVVTPSKVAAAERWLEKWAEAVGVDPLA